MLPQPVCIGAKVCQVLSWRQRCLEGTRSNPCLQKVSSLAGKTHAGASRSDENKTKGPIGGAGDGTLSGGGVVTVRLEGGGGAGDAEPTWRPPGTPCFLRTPASTW